jgi:nickel-dependent lactate racemase
MQKDYYLYLSQGKRGYFTLPKGWVPLHFVEAEEQALMPSIEQMVREALSRPTGTPSLQQMLSGVESIAIIVDDGTRPTPVEGIFKALLSHLADNGFSHEKIDIVVALGTHEAMKREALEARLGSNVLSNYKVVQHNAWERDLVPIRIPGDGRVVKINPVVSRADLRIGISSVLPHPMAGYGGGPKILMPGVCNFEFIRDHHMKNVGHPRSVAGATEGNPFHEGCFEVARAVGLDFSINCVYNQEGEIIRIIGGSLEKAFAEAVQVCLEKLGHKFNEKVDVTITSTYPHTHGHQLFKGLSTPDIVTKDTGAILVVAPVIEPIPAEFLNSIHVIKEKSRNNPVAYIKDAISKGMAFLPDKAIDYNMAVSTVFLRPKIRTILVSSNISREEAETMGLEYSSSLEGGMKLLKASYPDADVAIFPSGGLIVPITAWERGGSRSSSK